MCSVDKIQTAGDAAFKAHLGLPDSGPDTPYSQRNYPMRPRPVVRGGPEGTRELLDMNWGLVPPWAKDPKVGRNTFNARMESLIENKPMFRSAFKYKRCLLPATSYIEWRGEVGSKIPYEFSIDDGSLYAYAGLWEERDEAPGLSCTMVTTTPNSLAEQYHTRMPVILEPRDYNTWLSPDTSREELLALLMPFDADRMQVVATTLPR